MSNAPSRHSSMPVEDRIERFEQIVAVCVEGKISVGELIDQLQEAGATPAEASDYVHRAEQALASLDQALEQSHQGASDSSNANAHPDAEEARRRAEDELAWSLLRARVANAKGAVPNSSSLPTDIAKLLGLPPAASTSGAIPASVLAALPHLNSLPSTPSDPHLAETWTARHAYGTERALEAVIDRFQLQPLDEPITRAIWRDIVQDKYINFEKLWATMQPGYDHRDEAKEFVDGYVIVKKEQTNARKALLSESDWERTYRAWRDAVLLPYPHRREELYNYQKTVEELFAATTYNPLIAIRFDASVRERYAKSPFHLDDRNSTNPFLLKQMFSPSSANNSGKRPSSLQPLLVRKRSAVICQNWNLGICAEPCPYYRKHGSCSECGEGHRAKDVTGCRNSLESKRGRGQVSSRGEGGKSSGGSTTIYSTREAKGN